MSNYDVLVQPDGRYWYVQVPAIERSTQAKGLDDIEPMAKDLITVMNGDDNPELKVTFVLPKQAKQHVTEMFRQREIAKKSQRTSGCRIPTRRTGPTQRGTHVSTNRSFIGGLLPTSISIGQRQNKAQNDSVRIASANN